MAAPQHRWWPWGGVLALAGVVATLPAVDIPAGVVGIAGTDTGSAVAIAPHTLVTLFEALPGSPSVGQTVPVILSGGRRSTATVEKLGQVAVVLSCPADLAPLVAGPGAAVGQSVWTAGDSVGALQTDGAPALSRGTVSGRDNVVQAETRGRGGAVVSRYQGPVLEITAAINEGSPGGAVVDDAGRLVGLATAAQIRARRQGAAVPWTVIATDLELPAPPTGAADPVDPSWLVTIAWRRPGGLGNPESLPRPPGPVESAPPADRARLSQWWNAWFHQRQIFRNDQPCPAIVIDPAAGLLVTAVSNLAGGATSGSLLLAEGRVEVAVVAVDLALDLALIRSAGPLALPAAPLATAAPTLAMPIQVLGRHRADGPATRTSGVVSALGRRLSQSPEGFFQVDARADYGSCGGAILDASGQVAGLVVLVHPESPWLVASGVTLGVDAATLRAALGPLRAGTSRQQPPTLGLGVSLDDQDGLLVVKAVIPGTGAEVAGMKMLDVLVAVDGHPVASHPAVARILLRHRAGDRVPVTVERGARRIILPVELKSFGGGP